MVIVRQLNCHRTVASTELVRRFRACDLTLIQEPNTTFIKSLQRSGKVFCAKGQNRRVRSLIYLNNRSLDLTMLTQFSDPDICTVQIENQRLIFCSAYLDYKKPAWPPVLCDLVAFCSKNNFKLVIGADTNGHSPMWNSPDSNPRGEQLEFAIIRNNLYVHNQGYRPTFSSHLGESIIDVTLSNAPSAVTRWQVCLEISFSDHKIIEFHVDGVEPQLNTQKRSFTNTDWKEVAKDLRNIVPDEFPTCWTKKDLEDSVESLTDCLRRSLDVHAPYKNPAPKFCVWWNEKCTIARRTAHRIARRAALRGSPTLRKLASHAQRKYQEAIKDAKRDSWRDFIADIDSVPEMSRVNKILKTLNGPSVELGLIKDNQGVLAPDKQSSLELLLNDHFPQSTLITRREPTPDSDTDAFPSFIPARPWLSVQRFRAAVNVFKKGKRPGPDEFRAELLRALDTRTIKYILKLFNVSISLGHTPKAWREVEVIFLPKAGKTDYNLCGSFRPISLMSVLFKTLERLVLWRMEETSLARKPLHKNQFGSRKGMSTTNALSRVVNTIEHGIHQHQYVLGVFMDIKGAFNNLKYTSIIDEFISRGIEPAICDWYKNFLEHREVSATHGSASATINPGCGTPQGGVLSSICAWNLPFDNLVKIYDDTAIHCTAYVDDATLLITGPDPATLYNTMQKHLDSAQHWAAANGLSFCPKKTNSILFTNQHQPKKLPNLFLNGDIVPNVSKVKMLGITLDTKLTFQAHITNRIKACKAALMRLRPILGKMWSPRPTHCRWLIDGVIYPALFYGSLVWASALERPFIKNELQKLQRLCLTSIANVRYSTPTAALELIYNLPPLHLRIRERACQEFLRLGELQKVDWVSTYPVHMKRIGHIAYIRKHLPDVEDDDAISPIPNWDKQYQITIDREIGHNPPPMDGIVAFTDGSRIEGKSGAGVYIELDKQPLIVISEHLSPCTVFQSELRAIVAACDFLLDGGYQHLQTTLRVDSESALRALDAPYITSSLVARTRDLLQELGSTTTVELQWVKAHLDDDHDDDTRKSGNRRADEAAKAGAASKRQVCFNILAPRNKMKTAIRELHTAEWQKEWSARTDCRQSKLFLPGPDPKIWRDLRKLSHAGVSRTVRFLTGHAFLNRHNTVIKYKIGFPNVDYHDEALCRLCEEDSESPEHLITRCPCLTTARLSTLCVYQSHMPPPWSMQVYAFLNSPAIRELEGDEADSNTIDTPGG